MAPSGSAAHTPVAAGCAAHVPAVVGYAAPVPEVVPAPDAVPCNEHEAALIFDRLIAAEYIQQRLLRRVLMLPVHVRGALQGYIERSIAHLLLAYGELYTCLLQGFLSPIALSHLSLFSLLDDLIHDQLRALDVGLRA